MTSSFKDVLRDLMKEDNLCSAPHTEDPEQNLVFVPLLNFSRLDVPRAKSMYKAYPKAPKVQLSPTIAVEPPAPSLTFSQLSLIDQQYLLKLCSLDGRKTPDKITEKLLKKIFRSLAKKYHPDTSGGQAQTFILVRQHYHQLLKRITESVGT